MTRTRHLPIIARASACIDTVEVGAFSGVERERTDRGLAPITVGAMSLGWNGQQVDTRLIGVDTLLKRFLPRVEERLAAGKPVLGRSSGQIIDQCVQPLRAAL